MLDELSKFSTFKNYFNTNFIGTKLINQNINYLIFNLDLFILFVWRVGRDRLWL